MGGDQRSSSSVSLGLRYVSDTNRRATFTAEEWRPITSGSNWTYNNRNGVATFRRVPADVNLFVTADAAADNYEVIYPDVLDAFQNPEVNGITGGAFGDQGGFHHTMSLCPLATDQRQGAATEADRCGSFAFVRNYIVAAHVARQIVVDDGNNGWVEKRDTIAGFEMSLNPAPNRNLAGEVQSLSTLSAPVRTTVHHRGSEGTSIANRDDLVDERVDLYFGPLG